MFIHFSIIMIIYKKKGKKFNQSSYDLLFHNIENNLRELGFGDVSVNKKMKDMNKILYDILLKIEESNKKNEDFNINHKLVIKYFSKLKDPKSNEYLEFRSYFLKFFNFCFDKPVKNMLEEVSKFEI